MSEFVRYYALDGRGSPAVDLHRCREFVLLPARPWSGQDAKWFIYSTEDGRWIHRVEIPEFIAVDEAGNFLTRPALRYYEMSPEIVANMPLTMGREGPGGLPPELEPYRKYGDPGELDRWSQASQAAGSEPGPAASVLQPRWDRGEARLYFGADPCLEYSRTAANQFELLNAFESAGWSRSIKNPFNDDRQLTQTVYDLSTKLPKPCPIWFSCMRNTATWGVT